MSGRAPICLLLLLCSSVPLQAQLQGGGLDSGSGLKGGGLSGGGLNGGSLKTNRLQGGRLKTNTLGQAKLDSAKPESGEKLLNAATLKRKATELTEKGLGTESLQGAVSTIPRTQVGELLYDVASLLALQEASMKDVAVGYYMAVLADPEGQRHDDALMRLLEIFLDRKLEHAEAMRLYDSGLETMKSLVESSIGLTKDGHRAGLGSLQEVRLAYHQKRAKEKLKEDRSTDALGNPTGDQSVTGNEIDPILDGITFPLSELKREDVSKEGVVPSEGEER